MLSVASAALPTLVTVAFSGSLHPQADVPPPVWPPGRQSKPKLGGFTVTAGAGESWQLSAAEPRTVPPFPGAEAVIVTAPSARHWAVPVLGSIVAVPAFDET